MNKKALIIISLLILVLVTNGCGEIEDLREARIKIANQDAVDTAIALEFDYILKIGQEPWVFVRESDFIIEDGVLYINRWFYPRTPEIFDEIHKELITANFTLQKLKKAVKND